MCSAWHTFKESPLSAPAVLNIFNLQQVHVVAWISNIWLHPLGQGKTIWHVYC
jgi:hypothetical protein